MLPSVFLMEIKQSERTNARTKVLYYNFTRVSSVRKTELDIKRTENSNWLFVKGLLIFHHDKLGEFRYTEPTTEVLFLIGLRCLRRSVTLTEYFWHKLLHATQVLVEQILTTDSSDFHFCQTSMFTDSSASRSNLQRRTAKAVTPAWRHKPENARLPSNHWRRLLLNSAPVAHGPRNDHTAPTHPPPPSLDRHLPTIDQDKP